MNITYADGAISGLRDFRSQLKRVPVGGGIVYHTGQMRSLDRKLADAAMALFREGSVHLVQRRAGTGPDEMPVRDYIAIKRKASDRSGEIRRHSCLTCGEPFVSEGIHNRMYRDCRRRGDPFSPM